MSTRSFQDTITDTPSTLPNFAGSSAKPQEQDAFAQRFMNLRAEQQVQTWAALRHGLNRPAEDARHAPAELHTEAAEGERRAAATRAAHACAEELQCLRRHPELAVPDANAIAPEQHGKAERPLPLQDVARSADAARTREANERKRASVQQALRQLPARRQHELFHALADVASRTPCSVHDRLRKDPLLARARLHCERWQAELDLARKKLVKYRKEHPLAARFSKDGADRERQVIAMARRLGEATAELNQSYRRREICHRDALRREQAVIILAHAALPRQALRCDVPLRRLALERFAREHNALRDPDPSLIGQKFLVVQVAERPEGTFVRLSNGRRHFVIDRDAIEGGAATRVGATLHVQPDLRVTSLPERSRVRSAGLER